MRSALSRPDPTRLAVPVAGLLAVAAVALGGTAVVRNALGPAVTPPPSLPAAAQARCTALMASLPSSLAGQESRRTRPKSPLTRAYGTPTLTVRCGVSEPRPTGLYDCRTFGAQDWLVVTREKQKDTVFLSWGTTPAVEVVAPDAYTAPPLEELSPAVSRLPRNGLTCVSRQG